jgi:putative glutathione S-transferase
MVDVPTGQVVTNDYAQLTLDLSTEWAEFHREGAPQLYPEALRAEIDQVNDVVFRDVNNGVYRAGFASTQEAYEEAVFPLFDTLDELDARLATRRYLLGNRQTLADWRLFTTLLRFDPVYVGHFKCNLRRIADYPSLSGYLRDLYQTTGVAETVDIDQIKRHYYMTHGGINPSRIVPAGPILDLDAPHGRDDLGA